MSNNKIPLFQWTLGALAFVLCIGLLVTACKKQPLSIPPARSEFLTTGAGYAVTDDTASVFHIPVGVTNVNGNTRVVNYKLIKNTAGQGQQYTLGNGAKEGVVTIPADSALGFIDIKGIYAGYSSTPGRIDTLTFVLNTSGDIPPGGFQDTFTLTIRQYCTVVLADLLGEYDDCYDLDQDGNAYGYYTVMITGTSTGPTSAKLVITNLGDGVVGGYGPSDHGGNPGTTVLIDWSDPSNFTARIPTQDLFVDPTYGIASIVDAGGGTFSSCENTFFVNYAINVSAGSFGQFSSVIQR